jgi:hypothetical protein
MRKSLRKRRDVNDHPLLKRALFWLIIVVSVIMTAGLGVFSVAFQNRGREAEATRVAVAPTVTAEFFEFHYQKGVGYMNINRWAEARSELELIFEIDPNYRDVQDRLKEIYTQVEPSTPLPSSTGPLTSATPTIQLVPAISTETSFTETVDDVLYTGEQQAWDFAATSQDTVLLSFEARIDWHQLAGGTPVLEITVNDKPITGEFLVNKPMTFTYADGRRIPYYDLNVTANPEPYWNVFYSPDFVSNNVPGSGYQVLEGQAYLYVFDISDLVRQDQTNKITLRNWGQHAQQVTKRPITLVIRRMKLLNNVGE